MTGREDKGEDGTKEEDDRGVYQKYYDENDIFGGGPRLRDDEGFVVRLRVYIDDKDEEREDVEGDEECGWEIRQECNGLATVSDTEEDEKFMYGSEWEEQMGIMPVSGDIRICRDG